MTTPVNLKEWLVVLKQVSANSVPESLVKTVESLRNEMEVSQNRFNSIRNFGKAMPPKGNWRSSRPFETRSSEVRSNEIRSTESRSTESRSTESRSTESRSTEAPKTLFKPSTAYQSKFHTSGSIDSKILNTIIGNKLNAFTPVTYNDTRDFMYQIMDSGETEFIRDFINKVFMKATLEDLYCALFAKLIAEIAHRYPVMYDEMKKYHQEFLKIFDDVQESSDANYTELVKERQYRLGYGQFLSELASLNALDKEQLFAMVSTVIDKIWLLTALPEKIKSVEEFIDCICRLTKSLQERSPTFFKQVKEELSLRILDKANTLIGRLDSRPSLSTKARFGLMDLKDLIV